MTSSIKIQEIHNINKRFDYHQSMIAGLTHTVDEIIKIMISEQGLMGLLKQNEEQITDLNKEIHEHELKKELIEKEII